MLKQLLIRVLTKHQILILNELNNHGNYVTVTNLIQKFSEQHKISPSTLRWNVKQLKKLELIESGDIKNKGIPVKLTKSGKFVHEILRRESDV